MQIWGAVITGEWNLATSACQWMAGDFATEDELMQQGALTPRRLVPTAALRAAGHPDIMRLDGRFGTMKQWTIVLRAGAQ